MDLRKKHKSAYEAKGASLTVTVTDDENPTVDAADNIAADTSDGIPQIAAPHQIHRGGG